MVDKDKIAKIMRRYFAISGNFYVNDDGTVDVDGICRMTRSSSSIPVTFNKVTQQFKVQNMDITSLVGSPRECGLFYCSKNPITNLEGCPDKADRIFLSDCKITSLVGCGSNIGQLTVLGHNLQTLEGIQEGVQELEISCHYKSDWNSTLPISQQYQPIRVLHGLATKHITLAPPAGGYNYLTKVEPLNTILNKYAGKGPGGILQCASELNEAGWEDWAEL